MSSPYLVCLVVGGVLFALSLFGETGGDPGAEGRVFALRAFACSLTALGATGVGLERFAGGLGESLTLIFATLAGLAIGGWLCSLFSLFRRRSD